MGIGFAVGLFAGLAVHFVTGGEAAWLDWLTTWITVPIGQIFLRLLFMLVLPLLFSALVVGIAEMGSMRELGRVGWKTVLYTVVVSTIAVVIGIALVNLFQPGNGIDPAVAKNLLDEASSRAGAIIASSGNQPSGMQMLLGIIPTNVFKAAADNDILALMFFAVMIGVGIVLTDNPLARRFKDVIEGLFEICMTLIHLVIRLAPYAVACLVFNLAAQFGWGLIMTLAGYVGVALLAMALHMFVVYPLAVKLLGGMSPLTFFRGVQEAIVMAFSTASSNATLPTALKVAREDLKLPRQISRFVLTVGATANQNGTALFEGVTVLFLAQFFGIELSLAQQVTVMFVCILGGIGTAGVPAGSLPVIALICVMVGVPPEGIGLILGVDRLLDMCRTTLNVTGDLAAAVVVSRGEKDVAAESPVK
ncbi:MAG TPA: dicarboxylate/amino acid:cation symporter [Rhodanobacteraceae bacterium]|nr:dicarboxylate/amino acid:cation symporter [Rhodanobacteraceae bacterium]